MNAKFEEQGRPRGLPKTEPSDGYVSTREWLVVTCVAIGLAIAYCSRLFETWENWGAFRWDRELVHHAVVRLSVVDHVQFPLWNPYTCGGMPLFAHPEARVLSPFVPLHFVFGFLAGIKLEIVLHVVLGLLGTYALARHVFDSRIAAAVSAPVFMLNGMYAHNLTLGNAWFMSIAYVPWAVLGFIKSLSDKSFVWLMAASLALIFFEGGAHVLSVTLLSLVTYAAFMSLQAKSQKPLARLGMGCVLALGLGAIKFLPSYAFLRDLPRPAQDPSGYGALGLVLSLFSREPWAGGSVDENHMYIGALAGALFALGVCVKHEQRWPWLGLAFITSWLALGDRAPISAWQVVRAFPMYDLLGSAERFRIVLVLAIALFCGLGARAIASFARKRRSAALGTLLGVGLCCAVTADLLWANHRVFAEAFVKRPVVELRMESFRQVTGDARAMLPTVLRNLGTLACAYADSVTSHALPSDRVGYRGEAFLHETRGSLKLFGSTPNRMRISVASEGDGHVVINQNADLGWQVVEGNATTALSCDHETCRSGTRGLLAIAISRGDSLLEVQYRPKTFWLGAGISAAFLLALIAARWRVFGRGARR